LILKVLYNHGLTVRTLIKSIRIQDSKTKTPFMKKHFFILLGSFLLSAQLSAQASAWNCYVSDFSTGGNSRLPDHPTCNYIQNGILGLTPQRSGSTDYFVNYSYDAPICLSENFEFQIQLKNNPVEGGIPSYDVGFGLETANGRIGCSLMSNDQRGQPFTFIMVDNQRVLENSPLLVRDLRQWSLMKLKLNNHILTLSHGDTTVFSTPFAGNVCSATGFYFYFKGSGYVDFIKINNLDNNRAIYDENFSSCTNLAAVQPCSTPSVSAVSNPICDGDTLKITTSVSNNLSTRAAQFAWSGPNGFTANVPNLVLPKANRATGGAYLLKTTFNSCQIVSTSITPKINALPNVNLGKDTIVCYAPTLTLDAGIGSTFKWQDSTINRSLIVKQSGNYAVTVTSVDGCRAADTIKVDIAPSRVAATFVMLKPTCFGACNGEINASANGGFGAPYSYRWSGYTATSSSLTGLCAKDYNITVTDAKGCLATNLLTLAQPSKVLVSAKIDSNFNGFALRCTGDKNGSVTALARGGVGEFNYKWLTTPVQDSATARNLPAGSYRVLATDGNGCQDTTTATLTQPKALTADFQVQNIRCFGEKNGLVTLRQVSGGVRPYSVYFDDKTATGASETFINLTGGTYALEINDANKCQTRYDLTIVEPAKLQAVTTVDTLIHFGDNVSLFAGLTAPSVISSIKWSANRDSINLKCTDCTQTSASPRLTTLFRVVMVDTFGCSLKREIVVHVDKNRKIFAPTAFSPNNDGENDNFNLFGGSGTRRILTFKIFNRWGTMMYQRSNMPPLDALSNGWDGMFQGREASNDTYIWIAEIEFEDGETEVFKGDVALLRH
jgi:gliding motility-associated-like protein